MKKSPGNGGCWFCHDDAPQGLVFDGEFDTFVHISCLKEAIKNSNDEEAQIMSYLLESSEEDKEIMNKIKNYYPGN